MKILFIITSLFIRLNIIELTTVSSSYNLVKGKGLGSSFDTFKISEFTNKPKMSRCVVECNQIQNCTVAIYTENTKVCQIYSITYSITNCESRNFTEAAIKQGSNFAFGFFNCEYQLPTILKR
jgi:hypothetical protein